MGSIFAELLNIMGFIILFAYLLSRLPQLKRVMLKSKINLGETIFLSLVFGIIGILGTYFGIPVQGAIANSRVVGVLAGALLAGPWVGFGAGLLAGGHRFLIDIGGFTALACGVSTFAEGILGGFFYLLLKGRKRKWLHALYIGFIAEMMQMAIILMLAKPFPAAVELVKVIWLPMVTVNAVGVSLMVAIIQSIYQEKDRIIGALKLYRAEEQKITTVDIELTLGLAQLFSTQLELAKIEYQANLLNKAELKALQAQINPHFLFNALNTITSLIRSDPEKARHLLASLGDFFRNNLQQAEDLVPLHRELQHVRSYVALEEARFGDRLKIIFDIDPSASCYLPPFSLQPLVENAIKHGLLPKKHGGTVTVSGSKDKNGFLIKVKDNGVGIEPQRIKVLLSENGMTGCIGIANVNNRLKNVFGPEYGLQINSTYGQGTEVILHIPKTFSEVSKVV